VWNNIDRILHTEPYRTFAELSSISAEIMTNEISESAWTKYLDVSVDGWSKENNSDFEIENRQMKTSKYKHDSERYRKYRHQASRITGEEVGSSMASDASSGPQNLSLPVRDIEFGREQPVAGSFCSLAVSICSFIFVMAINLAEEELWGRTKT
jgi:hypothetical protein